MRGDALSILGPVKFQLCAAISGLGASFVVGAAITGCTTAIVFHVDVLAKETQKCIQLAQIASTRREQLQCHVADMTEAFNQRLEVISSDIQLVKLGISRMKMALEHGVHSEEEVLKWIWFCPTTKFALEQILIALDSLKNDATKHCRDLRGELIKTRRELDAAVEDRRRQQPEDNALTLRFFLWSLPTSIINPTLFMGLNLFSGACTYFVQLLAQTESTMSSRP